MKAKPDISALAFVQGGKATAADGVAPAPAPVQRVTKTFRIDPALDLALKRATLEHRTETGRRLTESDLLEVAIKQYLKI